MILPGLILNVQEDSELSRLAFELVGKFIYFLFVYFSLLILFRETVPGSERMVISCPSREERLRLVELLQKQIRSPIISTPSTNSTVPYVSRRPPPFQHLARYLARLIKSGRLTRRILRDILDGGETEHHRRMVLGCAFIDHSTLVIDLNHFIRRCRAECHLSIGREEPDSCPSPHQSRSIYIEKEFTLGVPILMLSSSSPSTSVTSSSSSLTSVREKVAKLHWSSHSWAHLGVCTGGSLDAPSNNSDTSHSLSRTQSLPMMDLRCMNRNDNIEQAAEIKLTKTLGHSTTVGAWISHFSFDSGLADVGRAVTRSSSRNALSNASPSSELDLRTSSSAQPIYRSTLYAHWWRKAKFPIQSSAGKGMDSRF